MKTLLVQGEQTEQQITLEQIINDLSKQREYLHSVSIEDLIGFFSEVVKHWSKQGTRSYIRNLSDYFSENKLKENLQIALRGKRDALDTFVDLGSSHVLFHAQPRGMTVHWLAGNVAILGLFSIFSSILTKNVCLVKASSKGYTELVDALASLASINTPAIKGKDILNCIAVVLVDSDDKKNQEVLSMAADIRVAWGGREAIESITSLKKQTHCEDIIFGPKYSYAVIDKDSLTKDFKKVAQRLAIDASVFDQYACSSPHTVFVQEGGTYSAKEFAEQLAEQMDLVLKKLLPKGKVDPAKAMEIINRRSEYEFTGSVYASEGTEWTVIYSEEKGLAEGCFSRFIIVKPIQELSELAQYNSRHTQTLGVAMTSKNKLQFLDEITVKGIDRCPTLGFLTFFEPTWDGMFLFDRLVRWVTIPKE